MIKGEFDLFINFSMDVKLIRMVDTTLIPSEIHVSASIERNDDADDYDIELGIAKCRWWFENIVSRTIAFYKENETAIDMFTDYETNTIRVNNMIMLTPDEPTDEVLGSLFQSKMNALANDAFTIEAINVESDNANGLSYTLAGDHGLFLPQTMDDWLEGPSFFDVPWWMRNDRSTLDVYVSEDTDITDIPAWAGSFDFLDKRIKKAEDAVQIIRPDFNPTVIKGGRDDE